jgi:hypothetical protein
MTSNVQRSSSAFLAINISATANLRHTSGPSKNRPVHSEAPAPAEGPSTLTASAAANRRDSSLHQICGQGLPNPNPNPTD